MTIYLTGDADADALLAGDDLALLIGMLLDQQVTMESAFAGPAKIRDRIGSLDAAVIADYDPDALALVFKQPPAVHRSITSPRRLPNGPTADGGPGQA